MEQVFKYPKKKLFKEWDKANGDYEEDDYEGLNNKDEMMRDVMSAR